MNRSIRQSLIAGGVSLILPALLWGNISNIASVTYQDAASNNYGPTSSNNGNPTIVTVVQAPSIALTKTSNPTTTASGGTVTFTIAYANSAGAATNVVITDVIPAGSIYVSGSASATASGVAITQPSGSNGNTITWTIGSVAAVGNTGANGSVSFKVTVN